MSDRVNEGHTEGGYGLLGGIEMPKKFYMENIKKKEHSDKF